MELSRLAVYLDSGAAAWAPPGGWDALAPADAAAWDALFAPGVAQDIEAPTPTTTEQTEPGGSDVPAQAPPERQYVLSPVRAHCFGQVKSNGSDARDSLFLRL